jgi:4-hydroxy-2-oxoheptanedioate aldolase
MNKVEYEMIEVLKKLKNDFGVIEIKAEFEAEGSRMEELIRLKDVIGKVELPLLLKTGGVEAVTDAYNGITLGVSGLVAPMAESAFAVGKFLSLIKNFIPEDNASDIDFAVNIETKLAYENIDEILALEDINLLSGITVGRVDFVGSYGLSRSSINDPEITSRVEEIFLKAKDKGFKTGLGGGISVESIDNILYFIDKSLIDKFETRKVVFSAGLDTSKAKEAILHAVLFEYLWLLSKRRYYHRIKAEDESRIPMIKSRMEEHGFDAPDY